MQLSTYESILWTSSLQSLIFLFKQRGGLDETGHLVEQQLPSPTDWSSKWENQMYSTRARLCQDIPLATHEVGIGLRKTKHSPGNKWGGVKMKKLQGKTVMQTARQQRGRSRNSPKTLQSPSVHTKRKNEKNQHLLVHPLLHPCQQQNTAWRSFQQQLPLPWCLSPKTVFVPSSSGSSCLINNSGFQWKKRESLWRFRN